MVFAVTYVFFFFMSIRENPTGLSAPRYLQVII